jgi:hypothetical protein
MTGYRKLRILVVAHVALVVVAGLLAPFELRALSEFKHLLIVPFFAFAFSLLFLLSLLESASREAPWKRLAGLFLGVLYLEAFPATRAADLRRECQGVWIITMLLSVGSLLLMHRFGVVVKRQDDLIQPVQVESKGPRFSIRGMMIVTIAAALLCVEARDMQAFGIIRFLFKFVIAICFVITGLVSLWATLGEVSPLRRIPAMFVLWMVLSANLAMFAHQVGRLYILLIMTLYLMALIVSLLIARSCGYRLFRRVRMIKPIVAERIEIMYVWSLV